jgi:hypothetical protein
MLAGGPRWQVCVFRYEELAVRIFWVYAYQIVPPQPSRRLGTIRTLLKDETASARGDARTWSGRLVLERRATKLLGGTT